MYVFPPFFYCVRVLYAAFAGILPRAPFCPLRNRQCFARDLAPTSDGHRCVIRLRGRSYLALVRASTTLGAHAGRYRISDMSSISAASYKLPPSKPMASDIIVGRSVSAIAQTWCGLTPPLVSSDCTVDRGSLSLVCKVLPQIPPRMCRAVMCVARRESVC